MSYGTVEERVDRLEALFGQFLTEMALINKQAEERNRLAEERHRAAEERHRAAEERNRAAEDRMARLAQEMSAFKDEMRVFKDGVSVFQDEMRAFKDEMRVFKDGVSAFQDEMRAFKNEMRVFKDGVSVFQDEMRAFKDEMRAFKDEMRAFKDEMRADRKDLNKKWGDLANKMGTIIEDILAPNLRRLAIEHFGFGEILDFAIRRQRARPGNPSIKGEFDTIVVGPEAVILGEAKSSPATEHADAFANKGRQFIEFFPEYSGRRLILVFGSWSIPEDVLSRLTALGIYGMQMGEETMVLANAKELEGLKSCANMNDSSV